MTTFNIGKQFSSDPSGRFYTDGDSSGEAFREEHLLPKLRSLADQEKLEIIIDDNIDGYGSSFLVEGFAGVVKYGYMAADKLKSRIIITYQDPDFSFYEKKIYQYIDEASFNSKKYVSTKKIKNK